MATLELELIQRGGGWPEKATVTKLHGGNYVQWQENGVTRSVDLSRLPETLDAAYHRGFKDGVEAERNEGRP